MLHTSASEMEPMHRETRRVLLEARNQLEALESASAKRSLDPEASAHIVSSFRSNVQLVVSNASALRTMLSSTPLSRREVWQARLRDLDDQVTELREGDARCSRRFRAIQSEARMREELFQRRPQGVAPGDAVIGLGPEEERKSLQNSEAGVVGIMATGRGALQGLLDQRSRLKGAKTKMLNIMNQIGVDRKLIAKIERRDYSDAILVYTLMVVILLLLLIAAIFKHHYRSARS